MSFDRNPWLIAEARYLDGLSTEDRNLYKSASAENLLYSTSAAETCHKENSRSRAVSKKLQPLVAAIAQYGSALDVLSNVAPLFLSPIWGSLRVLLHIASEFDKYYAKLVDMLERIGDVIPRFKSYERLFPKHEYLLHSLSVVYLDMITFCSNAKEIFLKAKAQRSRLPGGGLRAMRLLWKPFDRDFGGVIEKFRQHAEKVELEANLSHMIEAAAERKAQGDERDAQALERVIAEADRKRQLLLHKEQLQERLLQNLSRYDPEHKHRLLKKWRLDGTGQWVLNTPEFTTWVNGTDSSCLWCYGIPGSGKSILTTIVVDAIHCDHMSDARILLAYFYCDYSEPKTLEPREILGSLIKQLLPIHLLKMSLEIQVHLENMYRNGRVPDLEELFETFFMVTRKSPRVFIILDGIDECKEKERERFLPWLKGLQSSSASVIKLFVASRDEIDIKRALKDSLTIAATTQSVSSDISRVVEESVRAKVREERLCVQDPDLVQEIIDTLARGARGMFIWATLQIEAICEEISEEGVKHALRRLPEGLNETFARALTKIVMRGKTQVRVAQKIFKWLIGAKRTLTLEEFQEAVAINFHDRELDQAAIPNASHLIRACGSLVVYDSQENTIQLAHYTIRQFLLLEPTESEISLNLADFHFTLHQAGIETGKICLTYLNFAEFETQIVRRDHLSPSQILLLGSPTTGWVPDMVGFNETQARIWNHLRKTRFLSLHSVPDIDFDRHLTFVRKPPQNSLQKFRLLNYVVKYWIEHALIFSPDDNDFWKLFETFAFERKMLFDFRPWGDGDPSQTPHLDLFRWALENSHGPLARLALTKASRSDMGRYLNCKVGNDEHPLLFASRNGYGAIAQALLEVEEYGKYGDEVIANAINLATSSGHQQVAMLLLEKNQARPNLRLTRIMNEVFHKAVKLGQVDTTSIMLRSYSFASAINIKMDGFTPLHVAVMADQLSIVRLLAGESCIDVDIQTDTDGSTALHLAASLGHDQVLIELLEEGADFREKNSDGWSPFHMAARNGDERVARIMLEYKFQARLGIPPPHWPTAGQFMMQDRGDGGFLALHCATEGGHLGLLQMMLSLEHADLEAKTDDGLTILHLAVIFGHHAIVKFLLSRGADFTNQTVDGWPALHLAIGNNQLPVAVTLLQHHVNARERGCWRYNTAALVDCEPLELSEDFSVPARSRSGEAIIAVPNDTASIQHLEEAETLSPSDREILEAKSGNGSTALILAARLGHEELVDMLLYLGANTRATDCNGCTSLDVAIIHKNFTVANTLLHADRYLAEEEVYARSIHSLVLGATSGSFTAQSMLLWMFERSEWSWDSVSASIISAAKGGNMIIFRRFMLSQPRNRERREEIMYSLLPAASDAGLTQIVRSLLDAGIDPRSERARRDGWAPLCLAARNGHATVIAELMHDAPAAQEIYRLYFEESRGWTPLCLAARHGHEAVVRAIVDRCFYADTKSFGWTPLDLAARGGYSSIVKILLDNGAKPDAKSDVWSHGEDHPLHWATRYGRAEMVSELLRKGAKIDVMDINGCTPLEIALAKNHLPILSLMKSHASSTFRSLKRISKPEKVQFCPMDPGLSQMAGLHELDAEFKAEAERMKPTLCEMGP